MRNKLLIGVVLLLLIGGGYLFFKYAVFKKAAEPAPAPEPSAEIVEPTTPLPEQIVQISGAKTSGQIFGYWINQTDNAAYAITTSGAIYKINSPTDEVALIDATSSGLQSISASLKGEALLAAFGDQTKTTLSVFSLALKTWQPLPADATAASWSPVTANELAYLASSGIYIFNLTTSKSRLITRFNHLDLLISWQRPKEIFLYDRPSTIALGSFWVYNLDKKIFTRVAEGVSGLLLAANADGSLLIQAGDSALNVFDEDNGLTASLSLATLPTKCSFDRTNLYCAVPFDPAVLKNPPDDYLMRSIYTKDSFSLIDLTDPKHPTVGELYNGASSARVFDAELLKKYGRKIYFLNRYDRTLYALNLDTQ